MPTYHDLDAMVAMIDQPNRSICQRIISENRPRFQQAPGSSHNHQAWAGGYWDHITEAMNLWLLLYGVFESTGRLAQLQPHERFSRSDGLLVLFLHDIEKPWCYVIEDDQLVVDEHGRPQRVPHLVEKAARKQFAAVKIAEYNIVLTSSLRNALEYVEGIRDIDYSPLDRRMWPLAALCHACDMLSARLFHNFPLATGDAWGARRKAG